MERQKVIGNAKVELHRLGPTYLAGKMEGSPSAILETLFMATAAVLKKITKEGVSTRTISFLAAKEIESYMLDPNVHSFMDSASGGQIE